MTHADAPLPEPVLIDPGRLEDLGDDLKEALPGVREEIEEEFGERVADAHEKGRTISPREAEEWRRTLLEITEKLLAGRPFELRTAAECCAFTTVLEEADIDLAWCLNDELGIVLPECVAPLCAFADYDEYAIIDDDEDDDDDPDERPPIRHPMRQWRVTVTLEAEIDRTDHPCDPEVCPLEVPLRKRVTFKCIEARTRRHAETLALDRYEVTHRVREGAAYGARAVLLPEGEKP